MRVNDNEIREIQQRSLVNTGDISPEIAYRWIQTKEEKNSARDGFLFFKKKRGWKTGVFNVGDEVMWWATWRRSDGRLFHKTEA